MFYHLKQKNHNIKKVMIALLLLGVIFAMGAKPHVTGQSASELAKQKQAKQEELNAILSKITDYQSQIKKAQSQVNSLKNTLNILNLQIVETQAQIEVTENKIATTNLEIADVTNQIIETEAQIAKQKNILKSLISEINDLDQRSPLEIALENENFQQFLDQVQYISSIQQQSQESLTKIKQLKADLDLRQADLKRERINLDTLLTQLDLTKAGLAGQQKAKQQVLDQTKGQEKAYQKLLADSEAAEAQLSKEINDLDSQIAAKLGTANRLKPIHGLIAWPMQGILTQGYGNTGFTKLGYTYHNGIDIAGPPGTPIYATANGTVVGTGTGSGAYGNWVAIKHDVGKFAGKAIVSVYGHMSTFKLKSGQTVKEGELVGFEGNTGNTTRLLYGSHRGYHLHFTIFDARGFGVAEGTYTSLYGPYQVPYGATYNPLDFL